MVVSWRATAKIVPCRSRSGASPILVSVCGITTLSGAEVVQANPHGSVGGVVDDGSARRPPGVQILRNRGGFVEDNRIVLRLARAGRTEVEVAVSPSGEG